MAGSLTSRSRKIPAEPPVPAVAVTPSPSAGEAQQADKPPVVRSILAVQTGAVVPRSSADLLAELNAFESLRGAKRESFMTQVKPAPGPAAAHPTDDAATPESARAAFLQQASFEAARRERVPSAQPVVDLPRPPAVSQPAGAPAPLARPSPSTKDDPLAELMALSDEERIALFS